MRDADHYFTEQRSEATIRIQGKAQIASLLRQTPHRRFVKTEVQDRVHHSRHRESRARSHRNQQRVLGVAELLADLLFDLMERVGHLLPHALGKLFVVGVIGVADFGGDDQAGRDRQTGLGHLAESGALAAEQRFVAAVTFFEQIDPLLWLCFGCGDRVVCFGHVQGCFTHVWCLPRPRGFLRE